MIYTVIVTYQPDIVRLRENIQAVRTQCDKIIIVDNFSANRADILTFSDQNIEIVFLDENKGIGYALNIAMYKAQNEKADYFLTLDQDSIVSENMVNNLLAGFSKADNVALVAPSTIDINCVSEIKLTNDLTPVFIEEEAVITSGSIFDLNILCQLKGHNEEMFIDAVDFEVCYRLLLSGKKILKSTNAYLIHELGRIEKRKLLFLSAYITNHSALRLYYIARNYLYCYQKYGKLILHAKRLKKALKKIHLKVLLFEHPKREKLKMFKKGKRDSINFYRSLESQ